MVSHEAACILNPNDVRAEIEITPWDMTRNGLRRNTYAGGSTSAMLSVRG